MTKNEASKAIGAILSEYEKTSGYTVKDIGIKKIEITEVQDTEQQFSMTVEIETFRIPGNQWYK